MENSKHWQAQQLKARIVANKMRAHLMQKVAQIPKLLPTAKYV